MVVDFISDILDLFLPFLQHWEGGKVWEQLCLISWPSGTQENTVTMAFERSIPAFTVVQTVLTMFRTSATTCKFNSPLQFLLSRLFIEHFEEVLSRSEQVWGVQQQTREERRPDLGLDSWEQGLQFQWQASEAATDDVKFLSGRL